MTCVRYDTAWVPPHCGMVASGLEEDCVWNPQRIIVLRRVQVEQAAKEAAARKAAAAQAKAERAKATKAAERSLVGAASGGKGVPVESTSAEKSGRKHKVSSKPAARPAKARKASSSDVAQAV